MKSFRDRDFGAVSTLALTLALAFGVSLFSREESRAQSGTVASAMCEMAFVRIRGSEATPRPLTMDARYRGEHLGTYLDPITKEPWMVKYFDRMERDSLEVHYKNGVFVDAKGQKLNSNFDAESLTFDDAGVCSVCGPTMVSRQGMPGFAPATWHCDSCQESGPGIRPAGFLHAVVSFFQQADLFFTNLYWEVRMGRLSTIGWVRWVAESFGD